MNHFDADCSGATRLSINERDGARALSEVSMGEAHGGDLGSRGVREMAG